MTGGCEGNWSLLALLNSSAHSTQFLACAMDEQYKAARILCEHSACPPCSSDSGTLVYIRCIYVDTESDNIALLYFFAFLTAFIISMHVCLSCAHSSFLLHLLCSSAI